MRWDWESNPWFVVPVGGIKDWAMLMARERTLFREKTG